MPDAIPPVGAQIQAPNPMQGINTMSGIIGLQQQRQQLQTGQYQQATAQAESQQAQQKNAELQKAQLLVVNGVKNGAYDDGQGGVDRIKLANDISGIGPYAQAMSSSLLSQATEVQQNKLVKQNLSDAQQAQLGKLITGTASDPNLDNTGIVNMWENARALHPNDPDYSRMITSLSTHVPAITDPGSRAQVASTLQRVASEFSGAPEQAATTNAAGQVLNRNIYSGALSAAPTAARQGGPPQAGTRPQGPPGLGLNPTSTQVATATGAGTGQVTVDNQRFADITQAAAKAQTGISLADQVAALAGQVRTGTLTKEWADKLTALQQDNPQITARQMLGKYAAQLKTLAESGAATDSERAQIGSGMPTPESMDPGAVREAAQYLHGYFRMNQARGQDAITHVSANGTAGLTQKDTAFMQKADPFVYAFKDMNRADQKAFLLKRFGPGNSAGLNDFEQRVKQ